MDGLKLLLHKPIDDSDGSDASNGLLPSQYSLDFELDTSNLDSLFNVDDPSGDVKLDSKYFHELVEDDTRSDYVIFSDFYRSEFEITDIVYNHEYINWMDSSKVITPMEWYEDNLNDEASKKIKYTDPFIKCRYIAKFKIKEIRIPLIPDEWGGLIELGLKYYLKNESKPRFLTSSINIDKGEIQFKELEDMKGVDVVQPFKWRRTRSSYPIFTLHYNVDSSTEATEQNYIRFAYFAKSEIHKRFEATISDKNVFIYAIDDDVTDYRVIYCRVYKLTENE